MLNIVHKDLPIEKIVATYNNASLKENTSVVNPKMLDIVLYNCSSDKRRVHKDLPIDKIVATYNNASLKENTSVVNPTFKLSFNQFTTGIPNGFNYLYCPYLKRYYFVNDVRYCKGGIVEIECHVDVLKTYDIINEIFDLNFES